MHQTAARASVRKVRLHNSVKRAWFTRFRTQYKFVPMLIRFIRSKIYISSCRVPERKVAEWRGYPPSCLLSDGLLCLSRVSCCFAAGLREVYSPRAFPFTSQSRFGAHMMFRRV